MDSSKSYGIFVFRSRGPLLTGPQKLHKGLEKLEKKDYSPVENQTENCFLIDWLTVTFFDMNVDGVKKLLGLAGADIPWQERTTFTNGYPRTTFWNYISIRWGADNAAFYKDDENKSAAEKVRTDMGICLDISGKGCRCFEEYGAKDWVVLLTKITQDCGRVNVTRLDLAYDDHIGLLDIHTVEDHARDRALTCKARMIRGIWSDDWNDDIQGLTVEVGSRSSDVLIRFYDKAAERGYDHSKHWVRCETQLRQERAVVAVAEILKTGHVGRTASGILRNYCMFRVPSSDSNKCRWPVCLWWEYVLESMDKISLVISPGVPYNFFRTCEHMKIQYGQALITYYKVHGEIISLLRACLEMFPELKPKYQITIEEHKALKRLQQRELAESRAIYGFDVIPEDHVLGQVDMCEIFGPDLVGAGDAACGGEG